MQIEMVRQLDGPNMLLTDAIQLPHLFAIVALHDGSLKDALDMYMMGNSRAIITILKTLDGFCIVSAVCVSP